MSLPPDFSEIKGREHVKGFENRVKVPIRAGEKVFADVSHELSETVPDGIARLADKQIVAIIEALDRSF